MTRLVLIVGFLLGSFALSPPAGGLMCGTDQGMTPEQVVRAGLVSGDQRYDLAMVGRVRTVTTLGAKTVVDVDLFGVYGVASAPPMVPVTLSGVGIAGGSVDGLETGVTYFIPAVHLGPEGEPNYATTCDPISLVDDPETTAVELAAIAEQTGIDYSLPVPGGGGGGLVTFVVIAALLLLLVWTLSRRRVGRERLTPRQPDSHREP